MRLFQKLSILFTTAILFVSYSVQALPTLRLHDVGTDQTVTVADGSPLDSTAAAGAVTYNYSLGTFLINVTTGITYPILGSPTKPHLDLNSVNVSSPGAGSLEIMFSETGYSSSASLVQFLSHIGGTVAYLKGSSVAFNLYASNSNMLFDTSTPVFTSGKFGPGAFSSESLDAFSPTGPYSLTLKATITHSGLGVSSFDYNVEVPEPAPLALISLGFILLLSGYRLQAAKHLI